MKNNFLLSTFLTIIHSPAWHSGNMGGNPSEFWPLLLGEKRASSMYRCKNLWDSDALVK